MQGEAESAFLEFRSGGRPRAMARVFDLTAQELLLVAGNLARTGEEAEELVQQTFLAALEHREGWDDSRPLLPWLLGILLRLQRAERRRRALARDRATPADLDALASSSEVDPAQRAEDAELSAALAAAIESLPETSRDVLTLRLVHGLEPAQIAHALGRPLETVKTQLKRGKERLREALPRSLAALVVLDSDGLSSMRHTVLRAAGESIAGSSLALAGGTLVMKSLLTLSVALVLAGAWWWSRGEAGTAVRAPEPVSASATAGGEPLAQPEVMKPQLAASRESLSPATGTSALHVELAQLTCLALWDSDGTPAVGVTVLLWHTGLSSVVPVKPLAVSDAEGLVRFEDLPPGHALVASDRGGQLEFELAAGENPLELRIPAGLLVDGLVLDEQEQPVPLAELWISDTYVISGDGLWCARADGAGRFTLRDVEPSRALAARIPGRAPGEGVWLGRSAPGERVEVTLHLGTAGPRVRGRVRDEQGLPVVNAYVIAGHMVDPRRFGRDKQMYITPPPQGTTTDAEGRFAFAAVPAAGPALSLWVGAGGFAVAHEELTLETPETWVDVTLTAPASVTGVVRAEDGGPLSGVEITAQAAGNPPAGTPLRAFMAPQWAQASAWSDSSGAFELHALRATTVELVAELRRTGEARETVALVAGQTFAWNPVLRQARDIVGVVVDEHVALQGFQVSASAEDGERQFLGGVVTDSDGAFRLKGASRASYTLRVSDPHADVDTSLLVEGVTPGEDLEVVYPCANRASARIVGQLKDSDGTPCEPESIHLEREGGMFSGGSQSKCVGGRLETGLLPPGSYVLTFFRGEGARWTIGPFVLAAGQVRDLGEFVCPAPGRLEVELRDASGAALASARVVAHLETSSASGSGLIEVRDGRGTCESLQPGFYSVAPFGGGLPMMRTSVEIRSGETAHATLAVPVSYPRWFRYPPVAERDVHMEWRCDGVVLSRGRWGIGEGSEPLAMPLAAGHYEALMTLRDGRSATTEFEVSAATTGEEQAVVLNRP